MLGGTVGCLILNGKISCVMMLWKVILPENRIMDRLRYARDDSIWVVRLGSYSTTANSVKSAHPHDMDMPLAIQFN